MSIQQNDRCRLLGTGLLIIFMMGTSRATGQQSGQQQTDANVKEALAITTSAAKLYQFDLAGQSPRQLEFDPKSVMHWSNPIAGEIYGNVFVWTDQGRPTVIGSLYQWYSPDTHSSHEFRSLTAEPVEGKRSGKTVWKSAQPGVEFRTVPNQPVVGDKERLRARQAKALSKRFQIRKTGRDNVSRDLRLSETPIYRYGNDNSDVVDGLLFAFVQGTDPEVFLMIEARKVGKKLEWQYALARMNSVQFVANYEDQEIWKAERLPWKTVKNGREPYNGFGPFRRK